MNYVSYIYISSSINVNFTRQNERPQNLIWNSINLEFVVISLLLLILCKFLGYPTDRFLNVTRSRENQRNDDGRTIFN